MITVGPTVQKTVWIDAGAGDDRVEIRSGNAILVDKAEKSTAPAGLRGRNDLATQAFELLKSDNGTLTTFNGHAVVNGVGFNGLTIDNREDEDWFQFTLACSQIRLPKSSWPADRLSTELVCNV